MTKADPSERAATLPANTEVARDDSAPRAQVLFGFKLPQLVSAKLEGLNDYLLRQREKALDATPAHFVNNSSNIVGIMDITAEMMVFKATGSNLISRGNHGKPLHYLIDPPYNLYRSVASRAKFDMSARDLLDPGFYRRAITEFTDLEKSGQKDLRRGRLINRWQARSMLVGLAGMTASAVIPQSKEDPNETQRMGELWQNAPTQYVATRLGQALWVPGWANHTTQFTGLAKAVGGVFSFLSSYRNVAEGKRYFRNRAHGVTGIISALAGTQLMLGIDREQAWQNYGSTMWARMIFLPSSIMKRFYERDKRAVWYASSMGMFQASNTAAFLIGGAEKNDEGNIVDKKALRERVLFGDKNESETPSPATAISAMTDDGTVQQQTNLRTANYS